MTLLYQNEQVSVDQHFAKFDDKSIPISAIMSVDVQDTNEYQAKGGCFAVVASVFGVIAISNIGHSAGAVAGVGLWAIILAAVSVYMYSKRNQSKKTATVRTASIFGGHVYVSRSWEDVRAVKAAIEQAHVLTANGSTREEVTALPAYEMLKTSQDTALAQPEVTKLPNPRTTEQASVASFPPVIVWLGGLVVLTLLGSIFLGADDEVSDTGFLVTKVVYGAEWPYAQSEQGVIRCEPGTRQVTIELNGIKYGLNGKAQGQGGFTPSQSVSVADEFGLVKLAPDGWIERGLALCDY